MARNIKLKLLTASCALCIHGTFVCVVVAVWLQFVSVAAADSSTGAAAANSVHTTTLAQPTAWDRGYSWYLLMACAWLQVIIQEYQPGM